LAGWTASGKSLYRRRFARVSSTGEHMTIRNVGVVGAGLMGSGIAQVSAQAGFPTVVREVSEPLLQKGLGSIETFMKAGVEKGKVAPLDLDRTRQNLRGTTKLEDLADCDIVIEAIPERLEL